MVVSRRLASLETGGDNTGRLLRCPIPAIVAEIKKGYVGSEGRSNGVS